MQCPSLELPYPVTCCLHKNADVGDLSGERDQKYLKEMFDCKGGFKEKVWAMISTLSISI